jgi:hypothetical protein
MLIAAECRRGLSAYLDTNIEFIYKNPGILLPMEQIVALTLPEPGTQVYPIHES